jgi:FixJ family two-component response regulator/DNA-binding MarR family transcriptional regulator
MSFPAQDLPVTPLPGGGLHFGPEQRPAILTLVRPLPDQPPLHQVLAGAGYHVWRATTAAEAVGAAMRESSISILMSDLVLPSGTGVALLNTLRAKLPPQRPLAAIFMAEAASINDVVTTLRAGALDFLGRRLPPEPLIEAVRRAEANVYRQRQAQIATTESTRLVELAVNLAKRLTSVQLADQPSTASSAGGLSEEKLMLEAGASSVHALSLLARRQNQVTAALRAQAMRQRAFGESAANSASWAMLLDLHDKTLRNQAVSVSSLCLASGAPVSTALRRLDELVDSGLVRREKDSGDARRTLVTLTEDAQERMNAYLDAIA